MLEKYLKELNRERDNNYIKACLHAPLVPIAESVAEYWRSAAQPEREAGVTVAFGGSSIDCVAVNLHLDEHDSMKGTLAETVLSNLLDNEDIVFINQTDYMELEWRAFNFKLNQPSQPYPFHNVRLMVRFWYGKSKACRLEDSGETKPVMRVVCE